MSLIVSAVTKEFAVPGRPPVIAVADLSLEIEHGTLCALLGPSGCGKTTLLRMVAGFEQPTRGSIAFDGRAIDHVPAYRRNFPMVFQSYALFPHMSVADNVGYGLRVRRLSRREIDERVSRTLALLQLETERDRRPAQLSGGQQQRVALARALVLEPRLILLDEPLSNLDAGLRVAMRGEIRALQRHLGITALYVTHDQEEALAIADRVIVMNRGRIEQDGSPADIFHRPATEFVARFMGCPNIIDIERAPDGGCIIFGRHYPYRLGVRGKGPAGRVARAVLRSDAVSFDSPEPQHEAIVENTAFLGARVQLTLRLGDGVMLMLERTASAGDRIPAPGERVAFGVLPERLHCLIHGPNDETLDGDDVHRSRSEQLAPGHDGSRP